MPTPLLAKSRAKSDRPIDPEITLTGHTACVLAAADALFGRDHAPTPLAESWLRFFTLAPGEFPRFRRHLRVAAAAHDWGKANDGFQGMIAGDGEQMVRHEHLSGLLLAELIADKPSKEWLQGSEIDERLVLAAVIGHHVKVEGSGEHALGAPIGLNIALRFLPDHEDFGAIWRAFQDEVGTVCPASIKFPGRLRLAEIGEKSEALIKLLDREKKRLRDDAPGRRWMAALRAGMIAADAVGSAVVRIEGEDEAAGRIARWVRDCFPEPLTGDEIWRKVVKPRIAQLRDRGRWKDDEGVAFGDERGFSEFQTDVATGGPRVLLTAACGSGKTLAAWNWIKAQLDARPAGRVLFLYPTRATATEGFRDYVSWAPEDEAGLLSGTANYELQDMFRTPDDPGDPRQGRSYQANDRLFALGHWKKRIFSATADQFLPFMQYAYGPLCLLPVLVDSVIVVDEVHSFDESMFSTLRRFLREFPEVPVLCMTATLPEARRSHLVDDCGLASYPNPMPTDLAKVAGHPRYHVEWIDREGARSLARGDLEARRRVLWVSNRVAACQGVFEAVTTDEESSIFPDAPLSTCYHSRFTLDDRKKKHSALLAAFQASARGSGSPRGVFGATTQVCEMSLDLDAEVLITDLAPIASLIQRMGRCNRDSAKLGSRPIGRLYVIRPRPGEEKPYEPGELEAARRFVAEIAGRDLSQRDLEETYRRFDPSKIEPERLCPFLDSGPYAEGRVVSFRDIDEYTVPCVLDAQVTKVREILADRDPARRAIDGYIVPVPRRFATEKSPENDPRFPRWLSVARGSAYDPRIGFDDRKLIPKGEPVA